MQSYPPVVQENGQQLIRSPEGKYNANSANHNKRAASVEVIFTSAMFILTLKKNLLSSTNNNNNNTPSHSVCVSLAFSIIQRWNSTCGYLSLPGYLFTPSLIFKNNSLLPVWLNTSLQSGLRREKKKIQPVVEETKKQSSMSRTRQVVTNSCT